MTLPLGSTVPRIYTPPLVTGLPGPCGCGCALTPETSLGFSCIDFAEDVLGFKLMPWQRWILIHSMELSRPGRFRFRTVLIMVGRQSGKTSLVEIKNLWKMYVLRVPLIIGTAQNLDIAEESWDKAVEIVEGIPELASEVDQVLKVNGKKTLKLRHGSRWKVAAASRRGGRGLSGDDVNLDELREHQNWDAWAAVTKTTMARANAQIWAYSNAGDDRSEVLNDLQKKGREASENPRSNTSLGFFEYSAPDDCRIDDPEMWALAVPALGYPQGVPYAAMYAALETDPEPTFRTECLCQRVPDLQPSKIPLLAWIACADPKSQIVGPVVLSWEVSWQRDQAAIAVAGLRSDGLPHVEIIDYRPGTDWVPARLAEIVRRQKVVAIMVDPAGPGGSLLAEVTELLPVTLDPTPVTMRGMAHACGQLFDAVMTQQLRQLGDDRLLEMLRRSSTRPLADAWAWDRKHAVGDTSGLVAITVALHGLLVRQAPVPAAPPVLVIPATAYSETDTLATAGF